MPEVGIISLDSAENVLQAHGAGADGVRCSPAQVAVRAAVEGLGRSAALHRGDGGLRGRPSSGSGDRRSRPRGPTYRTGLRQAVRDALKERHGRCRGDRRGGVPSDHAVCGGEERGSAGSCDGVWHRRSFGPAAHADDQCVVPEARLPASCRRHACRRDRRIWPSKASSRPSAPPMSAASPRSSTATTAPRLRRRATWRGCFWTGSPT